MTVFRRSVLINPHFVPFDKLAWHFQRESDDTFPEVIIVEPAYGDDPFALSPDDNHPPLPIGPGEAFLSRVYRAVTNNPNRWQTTLMIVLYDEHGGFFDHVPPLSVRTAAPGGEYPTFETTGPRVPAIVVSPFVSAGSVCHAKFDHTSILRFLAEKFAPDTPGFSPVVISRHADGTLNSLAAALNLEEPRLGVAPTAPELGMFATIAHGEPRVASTPLQRAFAAARADAHAAYPDAVSEKAPEMLFHLPHPDTGKM